MIIYIVKYAEKLKLIVLKLACERLILPQIIHYRSGADPRFPASTLYWEKICPGSANTDSSHLMQTNTDTFA